MNSETMTAVKTITDLRVFFGHQSVGGNILEGLRGFLSESQVSWTIAELGDSSLPAGPALLHQRIGENGTPIGKMDHFAKSVRSFAQTKPQLAFMKLCYADIRQDTDIDKLIDHYTKTLHQLKTEYPNIAFGHVTVPLAPAAGSFKDRLKRLAGVEIRKERDNLTRVRYNARLRAAFPKDPLLDLEALESTRQGGTRVQFQLDGQTAYALAPEYAADGSGHLNATGSRIAAMELVRFVASAVPR